MPIYSKPQPLGNFKSTLFTIWGYKKRHIDSGLEAVSELPMIFHSKNAVDKWLASTNRNYNDVLYFPFVTKTEMLAFAQGAEARVVY